MGAELRIGVLAAGPLSPAQEQVLDELRAVEGVTVAAGVEHGLDAVLRLGRAAVPDGLLAATRFGVWSLRHGGFWEVARGETATEAILERLTGRPGEGVVLQRCSVATRLASYRRTREAITRAASFMPARVARDLLNGSAAYLDDAPQPTAVAWPPGLADVVRFRARMAAAWVSAQVRSIVLLERWHVGVVRRPIASFLDEHFSPEVEWLAHRRTAGYFADPFPAGNTLLMEEWDDGEGRATIAAVDIEAGLRGAAPRRAVDSGRHMAYPFAFEHDGALYCTPESQHVRGVSLYRLDDGRWTEQATLIEGFTAVDPTLVRHGGRWWLFCTNRDDECNGKLLLWSAADLLGPWAPHPANPVKADVRSSRPAGTPFVVDGELYRPAQDCAAAYGSAVVINRVTRLTPGEFAEEPVARVVPPPGSRYPHGLHTLAGCGGLTAVDGKRMTFAPRLVPARVAGKLRRAAGRARSRRGPAAVAPSARR
jgi:hypothetical protein